MARIVLGGTMGVDLTATYTDTAVNRFKIGESVWADSGLYIFGHADGAIDAGAVCRILKTGEVDEITTAESASVPTTIGVSVSTLADNEWGWFWRGCGYESVLIQTGVSADVQVTTTTTAGEGGTGGDNIASLATYAANSSGATALTACVAYGLLGTN